MLCKVSLTVSGNGVIRSIAYEFLFVFDCNYGHIWYPFWDIEISVKNRDFFVAVVSLNISLSHSRLLKLVPFENLGTFLFAFHSNYGSILYHFWQRYWSKIAIFSYPLHSTPPLGGRRRDIAIPFRMEKLEWHGYSVMKKKFEDMSSRFDRIPACDRQTDRQTDGQTTCEDIVRAMHSIAW